MPSHNPDGPGRWADELPELLKSAVGQLRDESIPDDVARRVLDRARVRPPRPEPRRPWGGSRLSLAFAGLVAAGLLGYLAWHSGNPVVVRLDRPDKDRKKYEMTARVSNHEPPALPPFGQPDAMPARLWQVAGNWSAWDSMRPPRVTTGGPRVHAFLPFVAGRRGKRLPQGRVVGEEGRELTLLGVSIQVVLDGPRTRTLVDHVFRNATAEAFAGTFECSLPDGDSPSYFAAFPDGERTIARATPKATTPLTLPTPAQFVSRVSTECWGEPRVASVVRAPRPADVAIEPPPTLSDAPNETPSACFRASVGRVRPGGFVRVVVASEGPLVERDGKAVYKVALPACRLHDLSVRLQADEALASAAVVPSDADVRRVDGKVIVSRAWKEVTNAGDFSFAATLPDASLQTACGRHEGGAHYLVARVSPSFPRAANQPAFASHAVFALDTSAAENPKRFARCLDLMRAVLENDTDVKRFNVLTFSNGAAWIDRRGWLSNTPAVRQQVLTKLRGAALEGATDVGSALDAVARPAWVANVPIHAFLLSDGQATWGDADVAALSARFEARCAFPVRWHCYQTGLGHENEDLFAALTRCGGGVYRLGMTGDLTDVSLAHRRLCMSIDAVRFEGGPPASDVVVAGRKAALHPGGDLLVAARFARAGSTALTVEGTLAGKKVIYRHAVEVGDRGELAPRAWGELAVGSLLAVNDPSLEPLAVAIARRFRVASRATSFAHVTGQDEDDDVKIAAATKSAWRRCAAGESADAHARVGDLLREAVPAEARGNVSHLYEVLRDDDFPWPTSRAAGALVSREGMPAAYLNARQPAAFLDEATRRADDKAGALRALAGLVERAEDRASAARVAAYRLLSIGDADEAVRLMLAQTRQRPHDPAQHRALGTALAAAGRPAWAALHYETALTQLNDQGVWFRAVRAEYADVLAVAARDGNVRAEARQRFATRLREIEGSAPDELRVSATWNDAASVVEVQLIGRDGKPLAASGPRLKGDREGPRVFVGKVDDGPYRVVARLATAESPETAVVVATTRGAGVAQQRERQVILLRKAGDKGSLVVGGR